MGRYFIGKNGQEYLSANDAEVYGGGMDGYRDTKEEVVKATYTELTGQKPPESPVDHVVAKPIDGVLSNPSLQNEPEVIAAKNPDAQTVPVEPTMPTETYVAPVEIKIVATEPVKPVETPQPNTDLNSKTDEELRAMCKAKKVRGFFYMKRENMIKRLA